MKSARIVWSIIIVMMFIGSGLFYYLSRADERQIHISSNPWVGFTPFIYAQEKGWLDKTPFRFMWLVDLSENARLYERGFTQGFTTTQYELLHFKEHSDIKPVFLIDRSFGADAILSNRSLETLHTLHEPITVYLEMGSLNEDFFNAFIHENGLKSSQFILVNTSQESITQMNPMGAPSIVISYAPYISKLIKKGFTTIASTETMKSFFVIDALYVDEHSIVGREEEYRGLKEIFNRALKKFHTDPREYYETIHGYLEGQSYAEFMETTEQLEWLNRSINPNVMHHLQMQHIATDRILP